ncbi:MAG: hypothetical protein N3G80_01265 [Candidatus Micrarchaeota archaeon]|nr:hypothetical protein [Candidatus Micrarchaeota archaeon]
MDIRAELGEFFKEPFNRALVAGLVLLGLILLFYQPADDAAANQGVSKTRLQVDYFYLPGCPHCAEQKTFNQKLAKEFPEIRIVQHDASTQQGLSLLKTTALKYGLNPERIGVPATFFANWSFVGYESEATTGKKIMEAIKAALNSSKESQKMEEEKLVLDLPLVGKIDPKAYSLPVLAIILGLVDGFNPCAMWVLVYLIALVMNLNDRTKIWLIVGSFVAASGILYFLFMTAWLNAFLLVGYIRPVTILIGLVALGGGILSMREYVVTKGEMVCKVGDATEKKNIIKRMEEIVASPINIATVAAIVVLAFIINSVEFVCSSAIPAVFTQVLALSNLSFWEYYFYIALYDFFFMLDDLIIFGLAAFAISGQIGQKYAKYCKIIGGALLFILGLVLLFAPHLLR